MSWVAISFGGRPRPDRPAGLSGSESFGPEDDDFRYRTIGIRKGAVKTLFKLLTATFR
jgi:hypothetical protein